MKIKIELITDKPVVLPAAYGAYQQALIYNMLDRFDADWLHEKGFKFGKRSFKLFTYSGILERGIFRKKEKIFVFPPQISFIVSSPVDWILEQTASNLIKNEKVRLENNQMYINAISVMRKEPVKSNKIKVKALSPIENHTTLVKPDGKKLTYYYTPFEKEFSELTNNNLKKKWEALLNQKCPFDIQIKPLFSGNKNEKVIMFGTEERKTVIKGWKGYFELKGELPILKFALDAGLGSRNSQGFGLITI
ncbi:MAG: CRISPR-associated endoribonuclease Cas6 [Candidatus Muiribacteriota bacterium]